jgi:hypothetical protein
MYSVMLYYVFMVSKFSLKDSTRKEFFAYPIILPFLLGTAFTRHNPKKNKRT